MCHTEIEAENEQKLMPPGTGPIGIAIATSRRFGSFVMKNVRPASDQMKNDQVAFGGEFKRRKVEPMVLVLALMLLTATTMRAQTNGSAELKPVQKLVTTPATPAEVEATSKNFVPVERVGVDSSNTLPLSLNEAIQLALENNNDINASRIGVEMAEHDLTAARGAYDPKFTSETFFQHTTTPFTSFLSGSSGSLKQNDFTSGVGFSGDTPRGGGKYRFDFSSSRLSSNNFFNALNPAVSSSLSLSYTQPLLRGRKIDENRRRIEIAKKNLTLTDVQFRQEATTVIINVEQAYWELVYALRNLQVQSDAVKQTRAQVETNKRQVKKGVLAPIDVVEAEAHVKIYEQNVYAAQEAVTRTENALKTLMLPDRKADLWSRALLPTTPVALDAPHLELPDAVSAALANRFELAELKTGKEINDINNRFYRDQVKPQVDLMVGYSSNGYAGTPTDPSQNPLFTSVKSLEQRVAELSQQAGLPALPSSSLTTVPSNLNGAYGRSLGNMLGQDNPTVSVGVRITLPLKNRTAKAELAHSLAEGRQIATNRTKMEQLIEADVRNTMQVVRSVEARLAAAEAARVAAEQQYTSEQRKFQAGMSTVFLVLQRQTDLTTARGREVQTQTDLSQAIAQLQRAMGNTFRYHNVAVSTDGRKLEQVAEQYAPEGSNERARTGQQER
ncbi:MAG TPA: TolC family protein [Pyrinomonadaceae bacterium]|nr:TolC family protein [Pyrinomonadaceae bacterium]